MHFSGRHKVKLPTTKNGWFKQTDDMQQITKSSLAYVDYISVNNTSFLYPIWQTLRVLKIKSYSEHLGPWVWQYPFQQA